MESEYFEFTDNAWGCERLVLIKKSDISAIYRSTELKYQPYINIALNNSSNFGYRYPDRTQYCQDLCTDFYQQLCNIVNKKEI